MSYSSRSVGSVKNSNVYDRSLTESSRDGREMVGENDISVLEKTKVDVQGLNRKLEDMRRELVGMRLKSSLAFASVELEQELELGKELDITRKEIEDISFWTTNCWKI